MFKERVIRAFEGGGAWDVWVLFDEEATWDTAGGEHVVRWRYTLVAAREEFADRLDSIADR